MLRVLLVDDETIIRESIVHMIDWNAIGYELIATATNGMEACDIIRDEYPDVVITDIKMPVMNGLELIDYCYHIDSSIQYIILSGFGDFEYAQKAMKYGVKHYLLKPTDKNQLIQALLNIHAFLLDQKCQQETIQQNQLEEVRLFLQKVFLTELLEKEEVGQEALEHYQFLINLPLDLTDVIHIAYVQSDSVNGFCQRLYGILHHFGISVAFPLIYVRNSLLLLPDHCSARQKEDLVKRICEIHLPTQSIAPECRHWHYTDTLSLLQILVDKVKRYQQITLYDSHGDSAEIRNNITDPNRLARLNAGLAQANHSEELYQLLHPLFSEISSIDAAKSLAISLLFGKSFQSTLDEADRSVFLSKLMDDQLSIPQIEQMLIVCLEKNKGFHNREDFQVRSMIPDMIQYMKQHLESENLSLKWLANNLLYVSSGYLSKQFIQETGERFSDFLNHLRMKKAKELLLSSQDHTIQEVAKKCGFGENPRYFSQVFKKYTGMTPSDFINTNQ